MRTSGSLAASLASHEAKIPQRVTPTDRLEKGRQEMCDAVRVVGHKRSVHRKNGVTFRDSNENPPHPQSSPCPIEHCLDLTVLVNDTRVEPT